MRRFISLFLSTTLLAQLASAEPLPSPAEPPFLSAAEISSMTPADIEKICASPESVRAFIDAVIGSMLAHYEALDTVFPEEEKPCEDIRLAIEKTAAPSAQPFKDVVRALKARQPEFPPACHQLFKAISDEVVMSALNSRFATLPNRVMNTFERCKAHPGFLETARQGVVIGVKKSQP